MSHLLRKPRKPIDIGALAKLIGLAREAPEVMPMIRDHLADPELDFDPDVLYAQALKDLKFHQTLELKSKQKEHNADASEDPENQGA